MPVVTGEERSAHVTRLIPPHGVLCAIPTGSPVRVVRHNGERGAKRRYEVAYKGCLYWVDADALVLP